MTEKRVSKYVLKKMLSFFEKYQAMPKEVKQYVESAYQDGAGNHYSSGLFDCSAYPLEIDCLKALIAKKEKETLRVKKARPIVRRYR